MGWSRPVSYVFPSKHPLVLEAWAKVKHTFPPSFRIGKVYPNLITNKKVGKYNAREHNIYIKKGLADITVPLHELGHAVDCHLLGDGTYWSCYDHKPWVEIVEHWREEDAARGIEIAHIYRHLSIELFARAYVIWTLDGKLPDHSDLTHGREWYSSDQLYRDKIEPYFNQLFAEWMK
jgi:hypothetical protein